MVKMTSGPDCWATATGSTGGTCTQAAAQPEWGGGWAVPRASFPWSQSATVCISHIPLYLLCIKANFMRGLEGRHKQVVMAQRVKALQGSPGLAQLVWSLLLEKRLKEAGESSWAAAPAVCCWCCPAALSLLVLQHWTYCSTSVTFLKVKPLHINIKVWGSLLLSK